MNKFSFISILVFKKAELLPELIVQILSFNLSFIAIIFGANFFQSYSFTLGYLYLYANTILISLFAGTNSFPSTVSPYTPGGRLIFLRIGLLEFYEYIFVRISTFWLVVYYTKKWLGKVIKKIRRFREINLLVQEFIYLPMALVPLFIVVFNKWKFTGS